MSGDEFDEKCQKMEQYIEQGDEFLEQKNYRKALEAFTRARYNSHPNNFPLILNIQQCHIALKQYSQAQENLEDWFKKDMELNSKSINLEFCIELFKCYEFSILEQQKTQKQSIQQQQKIKQQQIKKNLNNNNSKKRTLGVEDLIKYGLLKCEQVSHNIKSQQCSNFGNEEHYILVAQVYLFWGTFYFLESNIIPALAKFQNAKNYLKNYEKEFSDHQKRKKQVFMHEVHRDILNGIGKCYQKQNQFDNAEKYLKEAINVQEKIQQNINIPDSYIILAIQYIKQEKYQNAVEMFEKADQISKIYDFSHLNNWAFAQLQVNPRENYEKWNEIYKKAANKSNDPQIFLTWGSALLKHKYLFKSIQKFEQAEHRNLLQDIEKLQNVDILYEQWGQALIQQEKYSEALQILDQSKKASIQLQITRIFCQLQQKLGQKAIQLLERITQQVSNSFQCFKKSKNEQQMQKYLHYLSEISILWALYYTLINKKDKAEEKFQQALKQNEQNANAWYFYGKFQLETQIQHEKSNSFTQKNLQYRQYQEIYANIIKNFKKSIQFDPNMEKAVNLWGKCIAQLGNFAQSKLKYQDVRKIYQKVKDKFYESISINPNYVENYKNLGEILLILKHPQEAIEIFSKQIEISEQVGKINSGSEGNQDNVYLAKIYINLGNCCLLQQNCAQFSQIKQLKQRSLDHFNRAVDLKLKPSQVIAKNVLIFKSFKFEGDSFMGLKKYEKANSSYEKSFKILGQINQDHKIKNQELLISFYLNWGYIKYKLHLFNVGTAKCKEVLKIQNNSEEAYILDSKIIVKEEKNFETAAIRLENVLAQFPPARYYKIYIQLAKFYLNIDFDGQNDRALICLQNAEQYLQNKLFKQNKISEQMAKILNLKALYYQQKGENVNLTYRTYFSAIKWFPQKNKIYRKLDNFINFQAADNILKKAKFEEIYRPNMIKLGQKQEQLKMKILVQCKSYDLQARLRKMYRKEISYEILEFIGYNFEKDVPEKDKK